MVQEAQLCQRFIWGDCDSPNYLDLCVYLEKISHASGAWDLPNLIRLKKDYEKK